MLRKLSVRNYVLIDSLETEFPEGLIIITGQTGAGKSILLGALSLLLGAKADASMIGESSDNCVVEGEFIAGPDDSILKSLLEENDVDWCDGHLIVRRVVNPTGRSRSFVNDSPVPVQLLSSISSRLIDIHSQHQTLLLSDKHFQMSLLDHFAGDKNLLEDYRTHFRAYNAVRSELDQLEQSAEKARADFEYNKSRLDRLVSASLKDGELADLELEQKQLSNAEEIKSGLCAAENLLGSVQSGEGEISVESEGNVVDSLLCYAITRSSYTGGAHGMYSTQYHIYSLADGFELSLADLFDARQLEILDRAIREKIAETYDAVSDEDLSDRGFFPEYICPTENFRITPEGIAFFYNPYEIGCYALGSVEVTFTWAELDARFAAQ